MQKVGGVVDVKVSLKDGMTILDLKPGNHVTVAQLRQIIKNNGFVSKEASIVARGEVKTVSGQRLFEVAGTAEQLTPTADPQRADDAFRFVVQR